MKPTIAIILDDRREKNTKEYPVKLRVYHNYVTKLFATKWDMSREAFSSTYESPRPRGEFKDVKNAMVALESRALSIIESLPVFSHEEFKQRLYGVPMDRKDVFLYFAEKIAKLEKDDQIGTASSYGCAMKSLRSFLSKDLPAAKQTENYSLDLSFDSIDVEYLNKYEKWMLKEGNSMTTIGIYLRNLRTLFNAAIQSKVLSSELYPFGTGKYKIPQASAVKKSLDKNDIKRLWKAEAKNHHQIKARDFFMFSYFSSGMNIRDILELKFENLNKESIIFYRTKTKRTSKSSQKPIIIGLGEFQKNIIKKYSTKNSSDSASYVFPFFKHKMDEKEKLKATQNFTRYINQHLKELAKTIDIDRNISTYFARHSFTTNAIRNGASLEMISESLGHQSMRTTQNYWSGFEEKAKVGIVAKLESDLKDQ